MPTENRFKILQSKVQTPELQKHLIIRERLLKKIDGASEKMVILYGTVGYGKTVAMSNYVRIYEVEHAWYHLDVMDNDFWNFLEYLSAAFGTIWKEFCFDVSKYMQMQDDQQMFQQCSRAFVIYLNEFLNRVECGSRRKLLVLDNFQEIQNECIFDFIQRLVEESSEHLKILLATKSSLPTFAAAFVLREKASIIDMEVLAFTEEETQSVLERIIHRDFSLEEV